MNGRTGVIVRHLGQPSGIIVIDGSMFDNIIANHGTFNLNLAVMMMLLFVSSVKVIVQCTKFQRIIQKITTLLSLSYVITLIITLLGYKNNNISKIT